MDNDPLETPVLCNRQHTHNSIQVERNQRLQDQQQQRRIGRRRQQLQQRRGGSSRRCSYGVEIRRFWDLPLAAKRYLWAEYRTWDHLDNFNPAQEFRTHPEGELDEADQLTEWLNPVNWVAQFNLRRN